MQDVLLLAHLLFNDIFDQFGGRFQLGENVGRDAGNFSIS